MLPLPPMPPQVGWRVGTRLARDHYVRLDGNDYSEHPAVIGRRLWTAYSPTMKGASPVPCTSPMVAGHAGGRLGFVRHVNQERRELSRAPGLEVEPIGHIVGMLRRSRRFCTDTGSVMWAGYLLYSSSCGQAPAQEHLARKEGAR